jgi:hypothetical protein
VGNALGYVAYVEVLVSIAVVILFTLANWQRVQSGQQPGSVAGPRYSLKDLFDIANEVEKKPDDDAAVGQTPAAGNGGPNSPAAASIGWLPLLQPLGNIPRQGMTAAQRIRQSENNPSPRVSQGGGSATPPNPDPPSGASSIRRSRVVPEVTEQEVLLKQKTGLA